MVYLGKADGGVTVIGSESKFDGRTIEVVPWGPHFQVGLVNGHPNEVEVLASFPAYVQARNALVYVADNCDTLESARHELSEIAWRYNQMVREQVIYVLHLPIPYKHSRHYVGCTENFWTRIKRHDHGTSGVHMVNAWKRAGYEFVVADCWRGDWDAERHIKRVYKNTPYFCPICKMERAQK